MEGAYYNGQYLNRLERLGYSQAEIDNKLESTFEEMFYGPEGVRLCHCAGPDMMYIEDTGNHDVLCHGITEIKHIVDHLLLFGLDDALFVADLHDRAELILRDRVLFLVRIHMDHL